jgi:hypothetical protein
MRYRSSTNADGVPCGLQARAVRSGRRSTIFVTGRFAFLCLLAILAASCAAGDGIGRSIVKALVEK